MQDETEDGTTESLERDATTGTSRRDLPVGSASVIAAGTAVGMMGAAPLAHGTRFAAACGTS